MTLSLIRKLSSIRFMWWVE